MSILEEGTSYCLPAPGEKSLIIQQHCQIHRLRRKTSVTNPYVTGGGGFHLEHLVGSQYITSMYTGGNARGLKGGQVTKVAFQQRWRGITADDILVEATKDTTTFKLALQIKRKIRFSKSDPLFDDVITKCWQTFRGEFGWPFNPETDNVGVAISVYRPEIDAHYQPLIKTARGCSSHDEFFGLIGSEGAASKEKKQFIDDIREIIRKSIPSLRDQDLWEFLKCFVILHFDFEIETSRDLSNCFSELSFRNDNNMELSKLLFSKFINTCAELAATSGSVDRKTLDSRISEIHSARQSGSSKKIYDKSVIADSLSDYLKYLTGVSGEKGKLDGKPLVEYYVKNRAALVDKETWEKPDTQLHFDKQWEIRDFLQSQEYLTIFGASFGSGKTAFVKVITSELAKDFLADPESTNGYIPILVFLRHGLNNVYLQRDLEMVLSEIIYPEGTSSERKALVILDGLDESPTGSKFIMERLKEYRRKYTNLKAIVTTRLKAGLPSTLDFEKYVRVFPFSEAQVNEFFTRFSSELSFDYLLQLGLKEEEITKPLFIWMIAILQSSKSFELRFRPNWSERMIRSLIFTEFIHSIIRGKHKTAANEEWIRHYAQEKKVLRLIAALKQMYRDELTQDIVENILESMEFKISSEDLDPILTSYFYLRDNDRLRHRIDFIHESFKEYLLAEYYLTSIIEGKSFRLNNNHPSKETVDFLTGLIEMIQEKDTKLWKTVTRNITNTGDPQANQKDTRMTIERNTAEMFNEDVVVFRGDHPLTKELWHAAKIDENAYDLLRIHQWILLFVMIKFEVTASVPKESIRNLLVKTSNSIPPYLLNLNGVKLDALDLTGAKLSGCILTNANLSGSKLSGCNFSNANLAGADLSHANLNGTRFAYSDLSKTNLMSANLVLSDFNNTSFRESNLNGADLSNANFYDCDLTSARFHNCTATATYFDLCKLEDCIFEGAKLTDVVFKNTKMSGSKLFYASMERPLFSMCDLSRSTLGPYFGARFFKCNLTNVDLSHQNFSMLILHGCKFTGANLTGTKFRYSSLIGSTFTNTKLIDADLCHANLSLCKFFKADLSGADFSSAIRNQTDMSQAKKNQDTKTDGMIDSKDKYYEYEGRYKLA